MYSQFAQKLAKLRHEKQWTQAYAAKVIGIQQSYLSKLENGKYLPSTQVLDKLCLAYQVKPNALAAQTEITTAGNNRTLKWLIAVTFVAVAIILAGVTGQVSSNTYYTYKGTPVSQEASNQITTKYHVSDRYLGEKYTDSLLGVTYHHQLIAEKTVYASSSKLLVWLGSCLLLSVFCGLLARKFTG